MLYELSQHRTEPLSIARKQTPQIHRRSISHFPSFSSSLYSSFLLFIFAHSFSSKNKSSAMAPRGKPPRKNTRMDATLDAMRPLGFEKRLVRKTVEKLLDVYDGSQGWPFIEETSYNLLVETLLEKQQISAQDKKDTLQDNAGRQDAAEASRATEVGSSSMVAQDSLLPIPRVTEIVSPNLVAAQDSLLHTNDGLDSSSQTNEQDSSSPDNLESDKPMPTDGGSNEQGIKLESKTEHKLVDDVNGSSHSKFASNVETTVVRDSDKRKPPAIKVYARRQRVRGAIQAGVTKGEGAQAFGQKGTLYQVKPACLS